LNSRWAKSLAESGKRGIKWHRNPATNFVAKSGLPTNRIAKSRSSQRAAAISLRGGPVLRLPTRLSVRPDRPLHGDGSPSVIKLARPASTLLESKSRMRPGIMSACRSTEVPRNSSVRRAMPSSRKKDAPRPSLSGGIGGPLSTIPETPRRAANELLELDADVIF